MSANLELSDLDQEQISDSKSFISDFLGDAFPSMNLEPGRVFYDMNVTPGAYVHALNQEDMDRLRRSSSLAEIEKDPTLADDEIVNNLLSNYNITRKVGSKATGPVTVILTNNVTTSIGEGQVFVAEGLNFVTTQPFIGTAGALTTAYSRPIVERTDGSYSFTIEVQAETTGSEYLLKKDVRLTWTLPSGNYIDSLAEEDFINGSDTETNADLLGRMQDGISSKVMGGRTNITALLRETYDSLTEASITGNGDPEMLRDYVFEISAGGKADIYTRTSAVPILQTLTKDCLLLDTATKTFQASILRDDYPGFYEIRSIRPQGSSETSGSLQIIQEVRGLDLTNLPYVAPRVEDITQGAYSRYQTAVVQFQAPEVDISNLVPGVDTLPFDFNIYGVPDIKSIQDFCSDRGRRAPSTDYLVRAPIPMTVGVSMVVGRAVDDPEVDKPAIQQLVADAANKIGFGLGRVQSSVLIDAAYPALTGEQIVMTPLSMVGVLRKPDGQYQVIRSKYELEIPDLSGTTVSPRTVGIYLDPLDVSVSSFIMETTSV